jgi:hypothetical protein
MCLTGVDYFSTLGYQPGIAALAAGALSPVATLILVLLTLLGALPIYCSVARESPHGEGSIAMREHLLTWWKGKLFVLGLLGFVATDFIITITLPATAATAHIIENPYTPLFLHSRAVVTTLILIAVLGTVFLKGFTEAIGIAVLLVVIYLGLNAMVIGVGLYQVALHPYVLTEWWSALWTRHGNPAVMLVVALLLFPPHYEIRLSAAEQQAVETLQRAGKTPQQTVRCVSILGGNSTRRSPEAMTCVCMVGFEGVTTVQRTVVTS